MPENIIIICSIDIVQVVYEYTYVEYLMMMQPKLPLWSSTAVAEALWALLVVDEEQDGATNGLETIDNILQGLHDLLVHVFVVLPLD